ncbi:efflux transporter outer membrane subunit [Geoalkalibacter halelectricus]|uniref:Efflux transporter outer membrane subunit n=1 Tax=Geoalkalibacter halelectricus TaxID=2847045 RepID=A0ABY5ZJ92_9BACT|nr:efflux transporter outer membrane subunit [Geoalkalibacter halelectricus]MDO3377329.1 efflux transporter outer membrane subunit [Geoalkalibacter halelectricus]UWZ79200.1 efflux transporter outer membrane subunit [Geoalkalibacter halelectricus]
MRKLILSLCATLILAGCAVGPEFRTPEIPLPDQWSDDMHDASTLEAERLNWWTGFEDPMLEDLIERALDDNLDLRLQVERVREARARLGLAGAQRWPTLDGQAEAIRQRQPAAASPVPIPGGGGTFSTFSLLGLLGYEVDLWGRLERGREAAAAVLEQSLFSHEAVRLNLVTDLVSTYVNLRAAQQQLAITERTLESRQETLRLQQIRYEGGLVDRLALQQAQSEWEATRAALPVRREQVRLLESSLAVLVGMNPVELSNGLDFGTQAVADLRLPPKVPQVLPSELLQRRPDIRAAEAALVAATAQVGVAMADRLPRLNLALFYGSTAADFDNLLSGPAETWGMGASVLGPVVDFGRNRARVETAEALRDQAETRYRITVQMAFREVRDALILTNTSAERETAVRRQVDSLRDTLRLAEVRYEEGYSGFIEVLDAQRRLLDAELSLAEAARDRLNAASALYKALGGGW